MGSPVGNMLNFSQANLQLWRMSPYSRDLEGSSCLSGCVRNWLTMTSMSYCPTTCCLFCGLWGADRALASGGFGGTSGKGLVVCSAIMCGYADLAGRLD